MKPLLVQIGHLIVMAHMALGCVWHHGQAGDQCCHAADRPSFVHAPHDVGDGHSSAYRRSSATEGCCHASERVLAVDEGQTCGARGDTEHRDCRNDRCALLTTIRNDFLGAGNIVLHAVEHWQGSFVLLRELRDPLGTMGLASPLAFDVMGVRAHLFYGVLLN